MLRARADELLKTEDIFLESTIVASLEWQNAKWASALFYQELEKITHNMVPSYFWYILQEPGYPDSFNAVVEAWQPGEIDAAECARFIALLTDQVDALPQPLVAELADAEKASAVSQHHNNDDDIQL